jgi:hypothetical protein
MRRQDTGQHGHLILVVGARLGWLHATLSAVNVRAALVWIHGTASAGGRTVGLPTGFSCATESTGLRNLTAEGPRQTCCTVAVTRCGVR